MAVIFLDYTFSNQGNSSTLEQPNSKFILNNPLKSNLAKKILTNLTYFLLGIISSRSFVFGGYAPFGSALVAASPFSNLFFVTAGAVLGCLFPFPIKDSIRYMATILAVVAIRWTLNELKSIKNHPLFAPLIAMTPMIVTGIALSAVHSELTIIATIIMCITEGLLCAASTYFFSKTFSIINSNRGLTALTQQELSCTFLTICIALLAFSNINIGYISLGHVLGITAILFCSYYGSVSSGCIAGVTTGVVFGLVNTDISYITGAFAFGGLIAGLFSPVGKFATVIAFALSNLVITLQTGNSEIIITSIYEIMVSSFIFMVIPKSACGKLNQIFKSDNGVYSCNSIAKNIMMKLDFSANTLSNVSECIDAVATKFKEINLTDTPVIFKKTSDSICKYCGLKTLCWEKELDKTNSVFEKLTPKLKKDLPIEPSDFPSDFINRCSKTALLTKTINQYHENLKSNVIAQRRVDEIRAVVYEQFCGMSDMLLDLKDDLANVEKYDTVTAEKLSSLLNNIGITTSQVSCKIDESNRMSVEIVASKNNIDTILKRDTAKQINKICDRLMDKPMITCSDNFSRIHFSQRPNLTINFGIRQHTCNNKGLCGDSFSYFNDGNGNMIFIISDGMGTGGRAAVDAAMASGIMAKLIKAGLGFDCALKIVNSALLVKSNEESLATLDIIKINMFSGKTQIMKAGAPTTFIRKNNKILRVDSPSLPTGILTDVSFSKDDCTLKAGDCILMISDGICACGDEWVEKELLKWSDKEDEKEFSTRIVKQAQFRRDDGRDDDITAIAIKIA